jgi:outer membrane protein OmpA-like peptidoglycan-associated protein
MIRASGWCVLPLLAACSGNEQTAAPSNTTERPAQSAPGTLSTSREPGSAGASNRLTAPVSALSAETSDLKIRVTELGTIIDLPADALFDYDEATLTRAAEAELLKVAELIRRSPPGPIRVIGHTDSKGEDAYNQKLSTGRAQTVAAWLDQQIGIRQRTIQVSGKGETAPIAPNETLTGADDPQGRAKNRRVEVVIAANSGS